MRTSPWLLLAAALGLGCDRPRARTCNADSDCGATARCDVAYHLCVHCAGDSCGGGGADAGADAGVDAGPLSRVNGGGVSPGAGDVRSTNFTIRGSLGPGDESNSSSTRLRGRLTP